MSLKRNISHHIRKVRDLIVSKQDESELSQLLPMSSSLDEESSSSADHLPSYQVNADGQAVVDHEELKWILGHLSHWNLETHIAEVTYYIFSPDYLAIRMQGGIQNWTVEHVKQWVEGLRFVGGKGLELGQKVEDECVDGECFTVLCQEKRLSEVLGMDYVSCLLLELIVTSWKEINSDFVLPPGFPYERIGVMSGHVSDLTSLPQNLADKMQRVNKECVDKGVGCVYGQLVVLGYTEYRMIEDKWLSFGHPNIKFVMKRRKLPNAVQPFPPTTLSPPTPNPRTLLSENSLATSLYRINFCLPPAANSAPTPTPNPNPAHPPIHPHPTLLNPNPPNILDAASSNLTYTHTYTLNPLRDMYQVGRA
eukprot:gene38324-46574_t